MSFLEVLEMTKLWRRIMYVLLIVFFCVGAFLACIGIATFRYTSKSTGSRRRVSQIYFPFWMHPSRAWVIRSSEENPPSAVESFLAKHAFQGERPPDEWHLDRSSRRTLYGIRYAVTPRAPGRYVPFDAFGNEALLYDFLDQYQQGHTNLVSEIMRYLKEPDAPWTIPWRKTIQTVYYGYYLDTYMPASDEEGEEADEDQDHSASP